LHVRPPVRPTSAQRLYVVNDVAWATAAVLAGGWAGVFALEGVALGG